MFQLAPLYALPEPESSLVKCSKCKKPTEQQFVKIPVVNPDADPLELMKATRRLSLCSECGNMRLTT